MSMAAATTTTETTTATTTTTVETDGDELYPTTYDGPTNVVSILPNGKVNTLSPSTKSRAKNIKFILGGIYI